MPSEGCASASTLGRGKLVPDVLPDGRPEEAPEPDALEDEEELVVTVVRGTISPGECVIVDVGAG